MFAQRSQMGLLSQYHFSSPQYHLKLKPFHSQEVNPSMLWAAFTLAFFGFPCSMEFTCNGKLIDPRTHLTRVDVIFEPKIFNPNVLKITIKKSKSDPFRETAKLTIAKSYSNVFSFTALQDCLLQTYTE